MAIEVFGILFAFQNYAIINSVINDFTLCLALMKLLYLPESIWAFIKIVMNVVATK